MTQIIHVADFPVPFFPQFIQKRCQLLSGSPAEVFPQAETIAKAGLRPPQLMTLLTRIQSAGVPLTADDLLARTPEQAARAIERALKMKKGRRGNDAQ